MAKTIKEMAIEKYGWANDRMYIHIFEAGANAVLAEIEKALDLGEPPYLISVEQAYNRAERLIKELRGYGKGLEQRGIFLRDH